MTDNDYNGHRYLANPRDPDLGRRWARLRQLGLGRQPVQEFDRIAAELASVTGAPYAMVNLVGSSDQYFAGLYPASEDLDNAVAAIAQAEAVGRTMPLDHGYCPHVVQRRLAFPLDDVCDYPRFAGNPVVDKLGIRSYLGAPLIDHNDDVVLGTVCVVAKEPQSWGREGVERIKATAAELVELIRQREEQQQRGYRP